jgi:oligosaccharyl transferase complex subunit OST4
MISDDDLFSLAIFLGSVAMLLIVLYHFLEVNAKSDGQSDSSAADSTAAKKIPLGADPVAFTPGSAVASKVKPR